MGQPTMIALMLQTALLTLALSIPLFFDDLDLSLGVVVMMGALHIDHSAAHSNGYCDGNDCGGESPHAWLVYYASKGGTQTTGRLA